MTKTSFKRRNAPTAHVTYGDTPTATTIHVSQLVRVGSAREWNTLVLTPSQAQGLVRKLRELLGGVPK